nr:MAG TPA: hypothetical protein [Caudoviricetes sp.]
MCARSEIKGRASALPRTLEGKVRWAHPIK